MARTIAKDHDDKRAAILKTAAQIFASEGYGRASVSSVAAACGISKANIYHYYSGKDALLFDILNTHLSGLRDRICGMVFKSDDPTDQLNAILAELLLAYDGADIEHEVQLNALAALPLEKQDILREYQRDIVRFVRTRIQQMAPPGVADDKSRIHDVTMSVFAMVNWHYKWDGKANEAKRRDYAKVIGALVSGGLGRL